MQTAREHCEADRTDAARVDCLRCMTFLAPSLFGFYEFLTSYLGEQLGCRAQLEAGESYEQLAAEADVAFVCGLAYVNHATQSGAAVEPLAAPVLRGRRYGGWPVYFSSVVVRRDSPFRDRKSTR